MFKPGVEPVTELLPARRGKTFRAIVRFYEDEGKTKALNLSGLTIELAIKGYTTLASESGLIVNAAAGTVEVVLHDEQTKNAPQNSHHYELTFKQTTEGTVETFCPLEGSFTFS